MPCHCVCHSFIKVFTWPERGVAYELSPPSISSTSVNTCGNSMFVCYLLIWLFMLLQFSFYLCISALFNIRQAVNKMWGRSVLIKFIITHAVLHSNSRAFPPQGQFWLLTDTLQADNPCGNACQCRPQSGMVWNTTDIGYTDGNCVTLCVVLSHLNEFIIQDAFWEDINSNIYTQNTTHLKAWSSRIPNNKGKILCPNYFIAQAINEHVASDLLR